MCDLFYSNTARLNMKQPIENKRTLEKKDGTASSLLDKCNKVGTARSKCNQKYKSGEYIVSNKTFAKLKGKMPMNNEENQFIDIHTKKKKRHSFQKMNTFVSRSILVSEDGTRHYHDMDPGGSEIPNISSNFYYESNKMERVYLIVEK
ncbi:hypothetical protein ABFS83_08G100600 [Erythranthe nasuta]